MPLKSLISYLTSLSTDSTSVEAISLHPYTDYDNIT